MRGLAKVAAVLSTVIVVVACSGPEDPVIPGAPGEGSTECFGAVDGTVCAGTRVCVNSTCSDPACGDGHVTPPEECDLGQLNAVGAGCEPTCRFSCIAGDPARGCPGKEACIEDGVCDPEKHTCSTGDAKPAGAPCGTGGLCKGDVCEPGQCGDAVVTPPEACDNGLANGPKAGCEAGCRFTCTNPATDCAPVACSIMACGGAHLCAVTPDAAKNGQDCGAGLKCSNGACIAPGAVCGNGTLEGGEECDLGPGNNGPNTGCESNCKFSCTTGSCVDPNACHDAPTCANVTVGGKNGKRCVSGATKPDGATCGIGALCAAGTCRPSVCGDGVRDAARGEECDDGNVKNLDACDAKCKVEQDHRVVALKLQFATDAYCTVNAVGKAITFIAQGSFQGSIDKGVKDGTLSELFAFHGGGDPKGVAGDVTIGSLSGAPTTSAPPYDGTNDLEWWYTPNASNIDANRRARALLTGTFAGGELQASGNMNLVVSFGSGLANLAISGAKIKMPIGAVTDLGVASGNAPPGHLASEHLAPGLQSFARGGNTVQSPEGRMCGNISALSLDRAPVPTDLLPGGATPCAEGYKTGNRLLDVIVAGCKLGIIPTVRATQPDQIDPSMPVAGAGPGYTFTADASRRVNACKDRSGATVPLQTCLAAAAYSIAFKYATDRVIIR